MASGDVNSQAIISNGQLESHFHTRFADIRCSSDTFLYVADNIDHYADLENYCDDMHEPKLPLLLLGEKGFGKSALLANWSIRRKRNRRKNMYLASTSSHEFIFWHAVGCTRHASRVDFMLRRLMSELNKRFDLNREPPAKNDRLSWELPRFLDQASKKGSIIIVIDGINQLCGEDGLEVGLTWLPMEIPANVRFIVSVSSHIPLSDSYSSTGDVVSEGMIFPRRPRFTNELNRRQWHLLRFRPQEFTLARNIIMQYFHKTVQTDAGNHNKFDSFLTSLPSDFNDSLSGADGLVLFPSQVEDLVRHKCISSPQFLRFLLESCSWAAEHGYCIWNTLEKWLQSGDYSSLITAVFDTLENGYNATERAVKEAKYKSMKAGGVTALRVLYPWHPNFQQDAKSPGNNSSQFNVFDTDAEQANLSRMKSIKLMNHTSNLLDSLEDPKWIEVYEEAQTQLQQSFNNYRATVDNTDFMQSFQPKVRRQRRISFSERVGEVLDGKDLTTNQRKRSVFVNSFDLSSIQHMYETPEAPTPISHQATLSKKGHQIPPQSPARVRRSSMSAYFVKSDMEADDESLKCVPFYLQGGHTFEGLGKLFGDALALLYTAYCGLTENELWNILLQLRLKETDHSHLGKITPAEAKLILKCNMNRGAYEDIWRTMDIHKKFVISRSQFALGIRKVDGMSDADIETLLRLCGVEVTGAKQKINYKEFIDAIVVLDRNQRLGENNQRLSPTQLSEGFDSNLVRGGDEDSQASLGPLTETSLLSVLCCLGVLRSAEHGVLVLPFDNQTLRSVILEKFVIPRGGIEYWHSVLAGYFLKLPSTLRRSEELPWHLESTRRWFSLKDMLADLKTFEIMSTSDLCPELIRYWYLLIHGPLFTRNVTDRDRKNNSDDQEGEYMLLKNIEVTAKLGLAESVSKRQLLKDKVAPFDIVEIYNKALEGWIAHTTPNSQDIFDKLALIGSFLLKFCHSITDVDVFPPYIRIAVNTRDLGNLPVGFPLSQAMPQMPSLQFLNFDGTPADVDREGSKYLLSHYYYLRRWMWIQFPWFALRYKFELDAMSEDKNRLDESNLRPSSEKLAESKGGSVSTAKSSKSEHMRGFWDLKRKDPSIVFDAYQKTKRSEIRSYNRLSSSLDLEEYPIVHFTPDSLHPARKLKPLHKYRRSLKATVEASKGVMFSAPSLRSLHHNTLFPSTARDLLNRHIDLLKGESDPFILAAAVARAGDTDIPADLNLYSEVQNIYTNDTEKYNDAVKETTVEEETEKLAKLRAIADRANFVVNERRALLDQLQAEYHNRNALDAETTSKLTSGEEAIESLEKKHEVVIAAVAEADHMNKGYLQVLLVCEQNPSHTKHHLAMVEQEVKLAKQQLIDLVKFRHNIYAEAAMSDIEGSKFINDQARYYQTMKESTLGKKDKQLQLKRELQLTMLRYGFQKEEIVGYVDFPDDDYADEVVRLRDAWKDIALQEYSGDHLTRARSFLTSSRAARLMDEQSEHSNATEESFVEVLPEAQLSWNSEIIIKEHQHAVSKTNSKSIDDLCKRYIEAQNFHASLTQQGAMAESKVVLLRAELTKLTNYYVDITLTSSDNEDKNAMDDAAAAAAEKDDNRALDEKLILRQLYMNQIVRQTEKTENLLNEIRVALTNLIALLEANNKLMSALPQKPAPPLQSNADIAEALTWCEDKVIAITEVLLYDTSKLAGKPSAGKWQKLDVTNDNQPLPERQAELAALMETLLTRDPLMGDSPHVKHSKHTHSRKMKKKLGLSRAAIQAKDDIRHMDLKSPRPVMIPPKSSFDTDFDHKMQMLQTRQDHIAQEQLNDESLNPDSVKKRDALEMSEFVSIALGSHDSSYLLRRQNHLRSQFTGPEGYQSRGWAVDSLLKKKNLETFVDEIDPPAHLISKKKLKEVNKDAKTRILTKSISNIDDVISRDEMKQKSLDLSRSHQPRIKEVTLKELPASPGV